MVILLKRCAYLIRHLRDIARAVGLDQDLIDILSVAQANLGRCDRDNHYIVLGETPSLRSQHAHYMESLIANANVLANRVVTRFVKKIMPGCIADYRDRRAACLIVSAEPGPPGKLPVLHFVQTAGRSLDLC